MSKTIAIYFILLFNGLTCSLYSQWNQLPSPPWPFTFTLNPYMAFPCMVLPVGDGSIIYTMCEYYTPGHNCHYLSKSNDDFASGVLKFNNCSPYGSINNISAKNDSSYCVSYNIGATKNIVFTANDMTATSTVVTCSSWSNFKYNSSLTNNYIYSVVFNPYFSVNRSLFPPSTSYTCASLSQYYFDVYSECEIKFINDSTGFILCRYNNNYSKKVVIKTIDYGLSWNEIYLDSLNKITDFSFPSNNVGYLTKDNGNIFKTINGGNSWNQINSPTTNTIYCMEFYSDNSGFIGGTSGLLSRTTDGGSTWLNEVSNTNQDVISIHVFGNAAYFVNNSQQVFKNSAIVGVSEKAKSAPEISIYPNPSSGKLTFEYKGANIRYIKVINVLGSTVRTFKVENGSNHKIDLDLSELSNGPYFLQLDGTTFSRTSKLILCR